MSLNKLMSFFVLAVSMATLPAKADTQIESVRAYYTKATSLGFWEGNRTDLYQGQNGEKTRYEQTGSMELTYRGVDQWTVGMYACSDSSGDRACEYGGYEVEIKGGELFVGPDARYKANVSEVTSDSIAYSFDTGEQQISVRQELEQDGSLMYHDFLEGTGEVLHRTFTGKYVERPSDGGY